MVWSDVKYFSDYVDGNMYMCSHMICISTIEQGYHRRRLDVETASALLVALLVLPCADRRQHSYCTPRLSESFKMFAISAHIVLC